MQVNNELPAAVCVAAVFLLMGFSFLNFCATIIEFCVTIIPVKRYHENKILILTEKEITIMATEKSKEAEFHQ